MIDSCRGSLLRTDSVIADPVTRDDLLIWLQRIAQALYELRIKHYIFKAVWRLIEDNPELRKRNSHVYGWLQDSHAEASAMAIRRLCDKDDRTISLLRFLNFIKRDPSVVSRQVYMTLFHEGSFNLRRIPRSVKLEIIDRLASSEYDKLVGRAAPQPRGKDIAKEIGALQRLAAGVIEYANKRIAHHDKIPPLRFPALLELDSVIEHATAIVEKYLFLLTGEVADLTVAFQYDVLAPFRVSWLPALDDPKPANVGGAG